MRRLSYSILIVARLISNNSTVLSFNGAVHNEYWECCKTICMFACMWIPSHCNKGCPHMQRPMTLCCRSMELFEFSRIIESNVRLSCVGRTSPCLCVLPWITAPRKQIIMYCAVHSDIAVAISQQSLVSQPMSSIEVEITRRRRIPGNGYAFALSGVANIDGVQK